MFLVLLPIYADVDQAMLSHLDCVVDDAVGVLPSPDPCSDLLSSDVP